jgi:cytochrome c-type biogenesis protein CcmH
MILFWAFIILFTLIAIVFVSLPLMRAKSLPQEFEEPQFNRRPSYLLASLLAALTLLVGLGLYGYWGKGFVLADMVAKERNADLAKKQLAKLGSRQNVIVALRTQLEHLPMDANAAKGWHILGKLYFNEKNYSQAISAFETAVKLKPLESDYVLELVNAKFYINHRLDAQDKKLIETLLSQSPQNVNAINLLALDAYQQGNYGVATRYWEGLLKFFPANSEDSKVLLEMIQRSQQHLMANKDTPKIKVTVTLSKVLADQIKPSDVLFVYALPMQGPKIPLAVVRSTAMQWPVTVTLDESTSMIPGKSLATVKQFYIEARISKTGNAMPSAGDLTGKSQVIKDGRTHVEIDNYYSG